MENPLEPCTAGLSGDGRRSRVHAEAFDDVDYTGGKTIGPLVDQLEPHGIVFVVAAASAHVGDQLDRYRITERIGADHYFDTLRLARNASRAPPA